MGFTPRGPAQRLLIMNSVLEVLSEQCLKEIQEELFSKPRARESPGLQMPIYECLTHRR